MAITDQDEWLRPDAEHDEVTLEVDDAATGLVVRAEMAVDAGGRHVHLTAHVDGIRARHDADEAGPPATNWDRMRIGAVEWRMVEPLQHWELTADDPASGLRAYLAFSGSGPCSAVPGGYEQAGLVTGQLQVGDPRITVTDAPARRTHTWRPVP